MDLTFHILAQQSNGGQVTAAVKQGTLGFGCQQRDVKDHLPTSNVLGMEGLKSKTVKGNTDAVSLSQGAMSRQPAHVDSRSQNHRCLTGDVVKQCPNNSVVAMQNRCYGNQPQSAPLSFPVSASQKYTPEEIERKRKEAIKRRNKLSLRK